VLLEEISASYSDEPEVLALVPTRGLTSAR